jgi:hypothetical protein
MAVERFFILPVAVLLCLVVTVAQAATDADEGRLAAGLALVKEGKHAEAITTLESCLASMDEERRAAVHRILGHLYWDQALEASSPETRNKLLDRAAECYRVGGNGGDRVARKHYLSIESLRSPERGYAAAWTYLSWNGVFAINGWLSVIGNYGAAMTGGKGIPGMIDRHPMHAIAWGAIIVGFLMAALTVWLRGLGKHPPERVTPTNPPGSAPRNAAKRSSASQASVRRPSSALHPAPTTRPPRPASPVEALVPREPSAPRPNLDHLRRDHVEVSPEKDETMPYERAKRPAERDETDPGDHPAQRKGHPLLRDDTEVSGVPILPPGRNPPQSPPRRPR